MVALEFCRTIPVIRDRMDVADYVDSVDTVGKVPFKTQLVQAMNWSPSWFRGLYRARRYVAAVMGLAHDDSYISARFNEDTFPMQPGEKAGIFEVVAAHDDLFWMAVGRDRHLTAYLCMAAESLDDGRTRYHCTTTVEYRHWTGPLYFNLIKPFHFLIVRSMLSASVRQ